MTHPPHNPQKRLFIKTYGCQMNVYDSDRMADLLAPLGYGLADGPDQADLVILNTCHIREKASEKVYSELGRLKQIREARQDQGQDPMMIAVAGCVAQAEGAEIMRRAPAVDMVFGPQAYHRLPEMVARASRAGDRVLDVDFPEEPKFDHLPVQRGRGRPSAFLSIQEGCDKFCTFCVVPYTRGAEYSRPLADVLADARRLVDDGVVEITLIGQNVNAWHGAEGEGASLAPLIEHLAEIDGLHRIRYTTSHPLDMDDALIDAHARIPQLMPFLHLPVQSGSDRILAAMNRRHRAEDFLRVADRLMAVRPDLKLSSDFIVGFPGETEQDFENTLALVRRVGFIQAFSFKYSPRPGTPAAAMEDQVPDPVKSERLARLQALLGEQQQAFNQSRVGQVMPVLMDRVGRHPGQLAGRSPYMQPVQALAPASLMGRLVDLRIVRCHANSLTGVLAGTDDRAAGEQRDCA